MGKPFSNDLRKRVIEAKLRGDTVAKIASEKAISQRTVSKLWLLYKQTGSS